MSPALRFRRAVWEPKLETVAQHFASSVDGLVETPVEVHVVVCRKRPKAHYGTGANEGLLKDAAPAYPNGQGAIGRGIELAEMLEGVVWLEGAVVALAVTCDFQDREGFIVSVYETEVQTIGDLVRSERGAPPRQGMGTILTM